MTERKIAYEPHPVTPERKAELREQGLTIIDAIYKPHHAAAVADDRGGEITRARLDEALSHLPDGHTDPDYVVSGMRGFFGDLFTADDEARVRELVKQPEAKKPSEGLTVDELKAALTEKGIEFHSTALKADLQALLDAPTQTTE